MKNNRLQNIVPLKYNEFFSIHSTKAFSKEKINNLPIISSYSRNINKSFSNNKTPFLFKTLNNPYQNYTELFSKKIAEFDNNLEKVPYPSFLHFTNTIKTKNFKNKTKIFNQFHPSKKINQVYFDINRTEYNHLNKKCFSIELQNILNKKNKIKLTKNKNKKTQIDEILQKEKEEFRRTMNIPNKRNKILNDYSYIIYNHFFPIGNNNNYNFIHIQNNNFNKLHLTNILSEKKITSENIRGNNLIKNNTFFEIIIEKVIHMVEYKNHLNQEISINIVRNLLNEEINAMYNSLNNKNNCSKMTYESIRINKSTSTDDNYNFSDFRYLNNTYDNYDRYSNSSISILDLEKKARIKLERKLEFLNCKYGFDDSNNDEFPMKKYDIISHHSSNFDNYSRSETENQIKSKKNNFPDNETEEETDNIGDFIISTANNINDNLNDYKNNNFLFNHSSIFKTSNIKNLLNKFFTTSQRSGRQGLHDFKSFHLKDKRTINVNDFKADIIELYQNYLQMKEKLKEMEDNEQTNQNKEMKSFSESGIDVPIFNDSNQNLDNFDKIKPKVGVFMPKLSSNMSIGDFYNLVNEDKEFDNFLNDFGGYYSFGEKKNVKEILKKMKEENKVVKFKYNSSNSNKKRKNNRSLFISDNKSFLNKASEKIYKDKVKINNNFNQNSNSNNINSDMNNNENNKNNNTLSNNKNKYSTSKRNSIISKNNEQQNSNTNIDNSNINNNNDIITNNNIPIKNNEDIEKEKERIKEEEKERQIEKEKLREKKALLLKLNRVNNLEKKFSLENIMKNGTLNEIEKEFIKQTNNLSLLNERDKQQLIEYLKELESIKSSEQFLFNVHLRIKLKNLHNLIQQYIFDLYRKGLVKTNSRGKSTKDIFKLLQSHNFLEKQSRKKNEFEEMEDEEEEESGDQKHKLDNSNNDIDIDSLFIKGKRRNKSVDNKKMVSYSKAFHNLLLKKKSKKIVQKPTSAKKKDLSSGDWRMLINHKFKTKRKISKKKHTLFKKKKGKLNSKTRKNLMTYDYKESIPLREFYIEDEEIRQFQEEEKRKKLRQELVDQKMNDFFKKIQALKNGGMENFEKELEMLVDEQLERVDYSKEKENEYRRNTFVQDFDFSRNKDILTKQFKSKRMHYLSPIIFFTNKKKNNMIDN